MVACSTVCPAGTLTWALPDLAAGASHQIVLSVSIDGAATELDWNELVWTAYTKRVNLSAHAHYATPGIWYDKETEHGEPFAYHVFGTAISSRNQ